jgi:hypothetical protein
MNLTKNDLFILPIIIIAFFVVNPLITLAITFILLSIYYTNIHSYNKVNISLINLCCILCAVFMGCMNISKTLDNDLVWYIEAHKNTSSMNC